MTTLIPEWPLERFMRDISKAPALQGIPIFLGAKKLAEVKRPPRIVLIPTDGDDRSVLDNANIAEVDQTVIAHCWGADTEGRGAWDLFCRLYVAIEEIAASDSGDGGFLCQHVRISWETAVDTGTQGQSLEVMFRVRLEVPRSTLGMGRGLVSQTAYTEED